MTEEPEIRMVKDPTIAKMFDKYPVWCFTLLSLEILDIVTTMIFLSLGASEGNPIFAILFDNGMYAFAVVSKLLMSIVAMYFSYILAESYLKIGKINFFREVGMTCFSIGISMTAFIVSLSVFTIHDCLVGGVMCV